MRCVMVWLLILKKRIPVFKDVVEAILPGSILLITMALSRFRRATEIPVRAPAAAFRKVPVTTLSEAEVGMAGMLRSTMHILRLMLEIGPGIALRLVGRSKFKIVSLTQ